MRNRGGRDEWDSKTARERLSVLSDISGQQQVLCNEGIQIYKDKAIAIHCITTLIKQITEASACKLWSLFEKIYISEYLLLDCWSSVRDLTFRQTWVFIDKQLFCWLASLVSQAFDAFCDRKGRSSGSALQLDTETDSWILGPYRIVIKSLKLCNTTDHVIMLNYLKALHFKALTNQVLGLWPMSISLHLNRRKFSSISLVCQGPSVHERVFFYLL